MKRKGFTLVEMLAVIVILGILTSIVTMSVGKYRREVTKKELINLKATISDSYDNYRNDAYTDYEVPETLIKFDGSYVGKEAIYQYFEDLAFDGERITLNDLNGSIFELRVKGELLSNEKYLAVATSDEQKVKDSTCVVKATTGDETVDDGFGNQVHEFDKECVLENGNTKPSLEEVLCIKLVVKGEELINDFKDSEDNKSLCKYFGEPVDE